jgi:hypothetical protein
LNCSQPILIKREEKGSKTRIFRPANSRKGGKAPIGRTPQKLLTAKVAKKIREGREEIRWPFFAFLVAFLCELCG